jgi:hypothetical protein
MAGFGLAATGAAAGAAGALLDGPVIPPSFTPAATTRAADPDPLQVHELTVADADARAALAGLEPGQVLEGHWRVESIFAIRAGAVPVILSTTRGERFAVEIFRADPSAPEPLAQTEALALYLVNRGDGAAVTDEAAGLGVRALGRVLAARRAAAPSGLTSLVERQRRFPSGVFHVPV